MPGPATRRHALIATGALGLVGTVGFAVLARPRSAAAPAEPARPRTRRSRGGTFVATIAPLRDPIPVNEIHAWRLHLATPEGRPIEDATIEVDGLMPAHSHGMATQPAMTRQLGQGSYLIEGFKLQMPGLWTIRFTVTTPWILGEDVLFDVMLD